MEILKVLDIIAWVRCASVAMFHEFYVDVNSLLQTEINFVANINDSNEMRIKCFFGQRIMVNDKRRSRTDWRL